MVGRIYLSPGKDNPKLQLCDAVSLFRQWSKQLQRTNIVSLRVAHERIRQRVGRTLLYLIKRLSSRHERTGCSCMPNEYDQRYPPIDVSAHLPCLAILSGFANHLACRRVSASNGADGHRSLAARGHDETVPLCFKLN